jgi:hypothetical protein
VSTGASTKNVGSYADEFIVDQKCLLECMNTGPCHRAEKCCMDIHVNRMLQTLCPEIESRLQSLGWNGSLKHSPKRLVPISYQQQVFPVRLNRPNLIPSSQGSNHFIKAILDDLTLNIIIHEESTIKGNNFNLVDLSYKRET